MENQVWFLGCEYIVVVKENRKLEKKGLRLFFVGNLQIVVYENKKFSVYDNEELNLQNVVSENDEELCLYDLVDEKFNFQVIFIFRDNV